MYEEPETLNTQNDYRDEDELWLPNHSDRRKKNKKTNNKDKKFD